MRFVTLCACIAMAVCASLFGGEPAAVPVVPPPANPVPPPPAPAAAPAVDQPWKKVETKYIALPKPRNVLSPGFFDSDLQSFINFDKKGECPDTGLPPAKGAKGPLAARLTASFVWIDFNGDGKPGGDETRPLDKEGWSEPFQYEAGYEGGVTSTYMFRLRSVIDKEKYAVIRCCGRVGEIEGQKVVFLDDSGNGRYNDAAKDAVLLGDTPVTLLGKYMLVGEDFFELLMHEGGTTFEYRPAPKLETGWVDLFEKYKPPQKSENLRIHTLIVSGPSGSFSMSSTRKNVKVPIGAYDMVFGLFERAKETVYMKKGEKTTFAVTAGKVATPVWGGDITATFDVSSAEGKEVTVGAPTFVGEMTEKYFPENYKVLPVSGSIAQVYEDSLKLEHRNTFGSRRFDLLPNGQLEPLKFKPYRNHADEYEATISYNSGILGSILGRQRMQYVAPKKAPPKKPSE